MAFGLRAKGMTRLNDAIVDAAKALADRPEMRKAIVILSDVWTLQARQLLTKQLRVRSALALPFMPLTCQAVEADQTITKALRS